jgi:hypothetical protein
MSIRWIGVLALIGVFAYLAFQSKGQQETIATQEDQLADSTIILRNFRIKTGRLIKDSAKLAGRVTDLEKKVSGLQLDKANADADASRFLLGYRTSQSENGRLASALTATQRKAAADAWVGGVGPVLTTVNDSLQNRDYANLKGLLRLADSTVTTQAGQVATAKRDKESAQEAKQKADERVVQADAKLNKAEGVFLKEAQTKRFLGVGRKNAMRAGAEEVRAIRETP